MLIPARKTEICTIKNNQDISKNVFVDIYPEIVIFLCIFILFAYLFVVKNPKTAFTVQKT